MAITVISGAVTAAVWTTDKVMITTGTNSVTASVALSAKPTSRNTKRKTEFEKELIKTYS